MQAEQKRIIDFLCAQNTQFTIPVYQRNYDWGEKQCLLLLEDIINCAEKEDITSHFIGSIVYIHEGVYSLGKKEFSLIDGQQRITTLTILICVLYHRALEYNETDLADEIYERYLTDKYMEDENKYKLLLEEKNFQLLKKIVSQKYDDLDESEKGNNLFANYKFFMNMVNTKKIVDSVFKGIKKLIYVDIALERGKDDPQRIFESLNSTGLDLSQGDLIRNFILMNLDKENQKMIYEDYWIPIENNTKTQNGDKVKNMISQFMRDFLTLQFGKIPNQSKVYEEFKSNYQYIKFDVLINELKKIKKYSYIYAKIIDPLKENDNEIRKQFQYLKVLDQSVINPFIIGIYCDYESEIIDKNTLIKITELIQNYILRRYICGEPTNALNKIFMNLYNKIDKNDYYNSIEINITKQKFPDDSFLKESLKIKPIYKDRDKLMYLFDRIENYGHNELVDVYGKSISIEHIFPQKPSVIWKSNLSDNEYEKMMSFKDTIANLTLTGSNSNLGNKSFVEKRDLPVYGYKDSKLFLNNWLGKQNEWNLNKMDERFNIIFEMIIKIWKIPDIIKNNDGDDIFYCKGPRGYGTGRLEGKKFIILKGSKASKQMFDSVKKSNIAVIDKLLKEGTLKDKEDYYVFLRDVAFNSPSKAARIILGRSANGWTEWKTFEGDLLDEFRENK